MKKTLLCLVSFLLLLSLSSCTAPDVSSDKNTSPPTVQGSWVSLTSNESGFGLQLRGNEYVFMALALTGQHTAQAAVETGTFSQVLANEREGTLVMTPSASTCPDLPQTVETYTYSLVGETFVLSHPKMIVSFQRNTEQAASSMTIVMGCFEQQGGVFVPGELTSVVPKQ